MFALYEPLLVGFRFLWKVLSPRWWLLTLLLGLGLSLYSMWQSRLSAASQVWAEPSSATSLTIVEPNDQIIVDVSGAVLHPGMYQLDKNARIGEAITRAGGFIVGVDDRYVAQNINIAKKLQDEDKIYIPFASDTVAGGIQELSANPGQDTGVVSIMTATAAELESLSGIGTKRAADIISGRPYQKLEDVVDRGILSKALFSELEQQLSL